MPTTELQNSASLEALAKAAYDACGTVKPEWGQLGDVTKGVWREAVLGKQSPVERTRLAPAEREAEEPEMDVPGRGELQCSLF